MNPSVCISYKHHNMETQRALRRLKETLEDYCVGTQADIWYDEDLRPGDQWNDEIQRRFSTCHAYVVLANEPYAASDFISQTEWPLIRRRVTKGEARLYWAPIDAPAHAAHFNEQVDVGEFQTALGYADSLNSHLVASRRKFNEYLNEFALIVSEFVRVWRSDGPESRLLLATPRIDSEGAAPSPSSQEGSPRARVGIADSGPDGLDPRASPYVGPRPFSRELSAQLYGRDREADTLAGLIDRERLVVVYGASGSGKSSLVNSVLVRLSNDASWNVLATGRVYPNREEGDAEQANPFESGAAASLQADRRAGERLSLAEYIRQACSQGRRVVLYLDQFEELYSIEPDWHAERDAFTRAIATLLEANPGLHLVVSVRKDFLADTDSLADALPAEVARTTYRLPPMSAEGIREAIARPAAAQVRYEDTVISQIATELRKVRSAQGSWVVGGDDYVDLMQLQLVCDRLWRRLPEGIAVVSSGNLAEVAGDEPFAAFVSQAIDEFYEATINEVAVAAAKSGYASGGVESLRLGCRQFISLGGGRCMLRSSYGRVGRLPGWVASRLDERRLLSRHNRGGDVWYELSHDRLIEPVCKAIDDDGQELLRAADTLDREVVSTRELLGDDPIDWFQPRDALLTKSKPFEQRGDLFTDEAALIMRSSLANGCQLLAWSKRISEDYKPVFCEAVLDALRSDRSELRQNAARAIQHTGSSALGLPLLDTLLRPIDPPQRVAAATAVAAIASDDLLRGVENAVDDPELHGPALKAVAELKAAAVADGASRELRDLFRRLPAPVRWRTSALLWWSRLKSSPAVVTCVLAPAVLLAAVVATLLKPVFGSMNLAICQAEASWVAGGFHGFVAAVVWIGSIVLALAVYFWVFAPRTGRYRLSEAFSASAIGALSGAVGSAVIVVIVMGVYREESVATMGWATTGDGLRLYECLVERRFGACYLITGAALGCGFALNAWYVRHTEVWRRAIDSQGVFANLSQVAKATADLTRVVVPRAWPLATVAMVGCVLAAPLPALTEGWSLQLPVPDAMITTQAGHAARLFCDSVTQFAGGVAGLIGGSLGVMFAHHGVRVGPSIEPPRPPQDSNAAARDTA